ncbi:FAD/NAD-P-binding domain-containing protein [Lentinus tigrinus ALCF2SS1-7]|uniref:FAD/NAD-P-binding domain-containing protein n=1 Tax=Lentinus tigrinus ALCF2SS1-6 TaxID=1328759 RepID=A0A5C2RQL2_9APHY|nr:FAD/NAD-P-binding domain-containing protein [Lentinus tigrinus ALCF2SS1-6]RPD70565.1 FAD/NAD-P-binding domain-containing protein [Lentinus tigrinus ALCF2SS1-7]
MSLNPQTVASKWLSACTSVLQKADANAFANLFLPDGWLRDLLVFTWDIRSLAGREKISSYLSNTLSQARISAVKLDENADLSPRTFPAALNRGTGVEFAFTFECQHGHGHAAVRLLADTDGEYRAFTVLTMVSDLPGHEELSILPWRDDVTGIAERHMQKDYEQWVHNVETNPQVIILGAAQTGLQIAARFKQMDIPTLVIERHARVGDTWRKRYPTLTLHTVRKHHTLLYQPFPTNWPEFTPRDKLSDWLEHYASIQDLVVWTNSELQSRPIYDEKNHVWDVIVLRNGVPVKLRPAHIVLATGTLGRPNIPNIPDMERYHGRILHSSAFPGGEHFAGQKAVVVGAGNSSIDVCQDLALRGASSVTMVQRSRSCVMTRDFVCDQVRGAFPENVPLDVADFRFASMPLGLLKQVLIADQDSAWEANKELHEKLRKGGVNFDLGPEGQGVYPLVFERLGGYWMDKGGADLIADGRIKVKAGLSLKHFTRDGIVLSDGTELPADLVVFATGYVHMREANSELLGKNVIDQTEEVYGLDDEGEIKGSYRPSGHPGLWFATGDFFTSRFLSKPLAIQIKAQELGLMPKDGKREGAKLKN